MSILRGQLDFVDRERIAGWARDDEQPDKPVPLRVFANGTLIGQVLADNFRADLQAAGLGVGKHAFSLRVPGGLAPQWRHLIEVRGADGAALPGSPFVLEAVAPAAIVRNGLPPSWRGNLDIVTRDRIEGWAFQAETPNTPLALVVLDNGEVIARALANHYREDLEHAGMGDGRHAFSIQIPGGLSALSRHVIQVLGEADGCEMSGSPITLESAAAFDAALEHALRGALTAIASPADRERALNFLAAQTERLLQDRADAAAGREARLLQQQFERRWGKGSVPQGAAPSSRRALVIDDRFPDATRDAASAAILSHMRALQGLGYEVSFAAAEEMSPEPEVRTELLASNIECCTTPYYVTVEEVLRRQASGFDVIYLHRVSNAAKYLALARHYCQKARVLYSVADLHNIRVARQAKVEGRPELLGLSRRLRVAECTAASAASATLTHSSAEAVWLRQAVTGCRVHVVPWALPVVPTRQPWDQRQGIAFIGNFRQAPNRDAARFLIERILPRVLRNNPSINCWLAGSGMPESIHALAGPGILPLGHVADVRSLYERVRLVVAPLRYGAGVKGAVLASLAAGVPCVMTPVAAEGIDLPDVLRRAIGEDEAQMAAQILRLYANEADLASMAQSGLAFIDAHHNESCVQTALGAAIDREHASAATT